MWWDSNSKVQAGSIQAVAPPSGFKGGFPPKARSLHLHPFTRLRIVSDLDLTLCCGAPPAGEIQGDPSLLDRVEVRESPEGLSLGLAEGFEARHPLRITLHTPFLETLLVGGRARLLVHGLRERLTLHMGGVSQVQLVGELQFLDVSGRGASRLQATACPSEELRAAFCEAAWAQLWVLKRLQLVCSGAAQLELCGQPAERRLECGGAARLQWRHAPDPATQRAGVEALGVPSL